jgi:hypothetical protein
MNQPNTVAGVETYNFQIQFHIHGDIQNEHEASVLETPLMQLRKYPENHRCLGHY